jgi:hypothetical protein
MLALGAPIAELVVGGTDPLEYLSKLGVSGAVLAILVLLLLFSQLMPTLQAAASGARSLLNWLRPGIYTPRNRQEIQARGRVARLLLQNLDLLEDELHWQQTSFADVRVTIEARDTPQSVRSRLLPFSRVGAAYRTRSLSKALERESERIVLIQGPPGSGKSVAVRHFARMVLEKAAKARFRRHPLALCVSLRDYEAADHEVTAKSLKDYVVSQVNLQEAPELGQYLEDTLVADLASGDVLILLDSFDEIPAVFGTQQIDAAVMPYVRAIQGLMGGGPARCVVSSREYKGPRVPGWTRLELLGLSFAEQVRMLSKYGLNDSQITLVEPLLLDPRAGFSADMRNPLQLSLLASFVSKNGRPPQRPSELFDDYTETSINEAALGKPPSVEALTQGLQSFAFGLMKRPDAGLSTDASELRASLERQTDDSDLAGNLMEIAKRSKLLVETPTKQGREDRLAFAHRRVQEYFATQYVCRHPAELPPVELAHNPRWRETAVTLLQVSSPADQPELVGELLSTLEAASNKLRELPDEDFEWDPAVVHVLALLVAAYGSNPSTIPVPISTAIRELIETAWEKGTISDRKFALDCLPASPGDLQPSLIERAFRGQSDWLRMGALRDCSTLHPLPAQIDYAIRRLLITLLGGGRLSRDGRALDGDLRRLYKGHAFVRMRKLLVITPLALVAICLLRVLYDYLAGAWTADISSVRFEVLWWIFFPIAIFWIFQATEPLSFSSQSTVRRFFGNVMRRGFGWQVDEFETETFGLLLVGVVAIDGLGSIIGGGFSAANGDYSVAIGDFVLGPLLAALALAWGPSVLAAVHQRWLSDEIRLHEVALVFRRAVPEAYRRAKGFAGPLIRIFFVGILIQVVAAAVIVGVYLLLDNLAGSFGQTLAHAMRWILLGLFPIVIVYTVFREIRSRRRIKRQLDSNATLGPATLLETLTSFGEPSEASAYLEELRIRHADEVRSLPRSFIRQLIRLIESVDQPGEPQTSPKLDELETPLVIAIREKQLTAAHLFAWQGAVLDQLGQLDEFLRER